MSIFQAILFGVVQGFTEFLPISSSGHLYLLSAITGVKTEGGAFMVLSVFLHLCTLIPVVIVLWKEICGLFLNKWKKFWYLVIATIPVGVIGVVYKLVGGDEMFGDGYLYVLGVFFMITAVMLLFIEYLSKNRIQNDSVNFKTGACMGLFQAIGAFPGISRSGATLLGGTLAGVSREENASFVFLMSIPVIIAGALVEGYDVVKTGALAELQIVPMLVAGICAVITGYLAVKIMLRVIKKANYKYFSIYLAILSVTVIVLKATAVL